MRGSFLFLDQTKKQFDGGEKEKKEKEKKGRKNGKERKTKEKKKQNQFVGKEGKGERKEKGESRPCTLRFSVFRRSEVDRLRIKVCLLDESYE